MGHAARAGLLYFAIVFACGFALGVPRTLLLEPALGKVAAVLVELPVMLTIAWIACGWLMRRRPLDRAEAAVMGAFAFAWLMAAEAVVSVGVAGRSLAGHWALYVEPAHQLGLAGQLAFALLPLARAWRRPRAAAG